jgi:hypothetical protein
MAVSLNRAFALGFQQADPTTIGDIKEQRAYPSLQRMIVPSMRQWIPFRVHCHHIRRKHLRTSEVGIWDIDHLTLSG